MTIVDWFKRLGSRRGRMPISAPDMYARGVTVGKQRAGSPTSATGDAEILSPLHEELLGHVAWIGRAKTRRYIKPYHRWMGRAGATLETVDEKLIRSDPEKPVSFIVASTTAYVITTVIAMIGLEATMMYLSTTVFDATLGGARDVLAITAGVLLFLPGHWIGDLIHAAETSPSRAKKIAMPSAALAVLVAAAVAIFSMGSGRDANLRSAQLTNAASTLIAQASALQLQAQTLATPVRVVKQPQLQPEVQTQVTSLRVQAAADTKRAATLNAQAERMKTLKFLAFVQLLAVISGAAGGYFFAAAAETRRTRRERRSARKALAIRAHVISIVFELVGYALTSNGAAGTELAAEGGHRWLVGTDPGKDGEGESAMSSVDRIVEEFADLLLRDTRLQRPRTKDRANSATPSSTTADGHGADRSASGEGTLQQIVERMHNESNNHIDPDISPGATERS